jgi:hypothetical protein
MYTIGIGGARALRFGSDSFAKQDWDGFTLSRSGREFSDERTTDRAQTLSMSMAKASATHRLTVTRR